MPGSSGTVYRSASVATALADARRWLDRHYANSEGLCVICQAAAPCEVANAAAAFLAERRALLCRDTCPRSSTVDKPERVLLTFGWQRWFALRRRPGNGNARDSEPFRVTSCGVG